MEISVGDVCTLRAYEGFPRRTVLVIDPNVYNFKAKEWIFIKFFVLTEKGEEKYEVSTCSVKRVSKNLVPLQDFLLPLMKY